ncbi:hypothetical protein LINGRAHAP2_LOCUS25192 [Linum grandiflorum]
MDMTSSGLRTMRTTSVGHTSMPTLMQITTQQLVTW